MVHNVNGSTPENSTPSTEADTQGTQHISRSVTTTIREIRITRNLSQKAGFPADER
jgi:hypothetical protein